MAPGRAAGFKTTGGKTSIGGVGGRGVAGKGLGMGGKFKRHRSAAPYISENRNPLTVCRKVLRDTINGITKSDIRRIARRGGVKRISGSIYEEIRKQIMVFLKKLLFVSVQSSTKDGI